MDCVICCESMFHLFHEPMSMGCKCHDRLCQRCAKVGGVTKCPTCRKYKKQPKVDRKLLKNEWKQGNLMPCPGCKKDVYTRYLHRHETKCPKYRDVIQKLFEEDLRVRRIENERNEKAMADMESRLDLQADTIDELEEHVDELERLSKRQEEERQLYVIEHGRLLRSLESIMSPLFTNMRSLETVYSLMSQAACSLRTSRAHHQVLRRQHFMSSSSSSTPLPSPSVNVPPAPPAFPAVVVAVGGGALQVQPPSHLQTPHRPPPLGLLGDHHHHHHRHHRRQTDRVQETREEGEVSEDDESIDSSSV